MNELKLFAVALMVTMGMGIAATPGFADGMPDSGPVLAEASQASQTKIIILTASKACNCKLRLCINGAAAFNAAAAQYPQAPAPEIVDEVREPARLREIAKKYRVTMLPAVLFLDSGGNLKKLHQGAFKTEDIDESLKQYCTQPS